MPTLYIHAGTPKTGTTTLQSFWDNNRTLLSKHANFYYPKAGINPLRGGAHHELFPIEQKLWAKLSKELTPFHDHDVIISTESLWNRKFEALQGKNFEIIQRTFPGYTIKIILYLRRLDDFFKSTFNQKLKYGDVFTPKGPSALNRAMPHSYSEYFQHVYRTGKNGTLFLTERLETAANIVGKENLLLRLYDKTTLKGGDIVADFFAFLGRGLSEGPHPATHTNRSLPNEALPFIARDFLPLPGPDGLREEIIELLTRAYTFPKGSGVGDDHLAEFKTEIDKIDEYIPGCKALFMERELSFSFPEVDAKDPQTMFLTALLYKLLMRQHKKSNMPKNYCKTLLATMLHPRPWRYAVSSQHIKQKLKALLNKPKA